MSVIVKVYSNHGLQIDDYFQGVRLIEDVLNVKIENRDKRGFDLTEDETDIIHFAKHEYFSKRFLEDSVIWIFSNYRICDYIRIYKHFVDFNLSGKYNLKTHIWRDLISKKGLNENKGFEKEFEKSLEEWNKTRSYILSVTRKLFGNTIIYLNDGSSGLAEGENAIWDGEDLSDVLKKLDNVSLPIRYGELEIGDKEFTDINWFLERV